MRQSIGGVILLAWLTGCSGAPVPSGRESPVVIFAAASTAEAVEEVARSFEAAEGVEVQTVFAGSSALARQVEAGAEADLFLSASPEWVDYLAKRDLIQESRDLLSNRLVVVVPVGSSYVPSDPAGLRSPQIQRIAMGDPEAVPAGAYGRGTLENLALWEELRPRIVPAGDVRQALLYVERGEAEAGIVYATDARLSKDVKIAFVFPASLTQPIRYPLALLRPSAEKPSARRFYDYLASLHGLEVFKQQGFIVSASAR